MVNAFPSAALNEPPQAAAEIENSSPKESDLAGKAASKEDQARLRKVAVLLVCLCLAFGIFLVDILVPRGINVSVLYVVPIILLQSATSTLYTLLTAALCGVLTSVGLVLSPDIGVELKVVLADYAIVMMLLVVTAMLGVIASRRSVQLQTVSTLLTMCAWTKKVKVRGEWISLEDYLKHDIGVTVTHGISVRRRNSSWPTGTA